MTEQANINWKYLPYWQWSPLFKDAIILFEINCLLSKYTQG